MSIVVIAGKLGIRQDETRSAACDESQTLVCEERDEVMWLVSKGLIRITCLLSMSFV